jgi:malonyl-ACP O-methyltransferase BioC/pimeloyl-ACP methyl ester esterase
VPELSTHDGSHLFFEDVGSGPTLLFVHGWAMSGRVWRYQQKQFTETHRVITLDLRGHGTSSVPATGPTIDDCAADIETLLKRLDLKQVTLIAWSMGVLATLRAFPAIRDRVAGLVFVGGTPRFTTGDGFPHGLPPDEVRGMALRLKRQYGRTMEEFFREMFAKEEVDSERYRQIVQDIVKGGQLPETRVALRSLESLAAADLRPSLAAVDRPVLLIHGEEDRICLPEASRYMAEQLPGARMELLPGIGHAPFLSRPDLFNSLLGMFLGEVPDVHPSPFTLHPSPPPTIDRNRVRIAFDSQAAEYESYAWVQRRVVERLLALLTQVHPAPRSVLDIGCGTGMLLRGVGEHFPDATLAGIDLAPGMVTATRSALTERKGAVVVAGDAEQLPFPDGSFDLAVSTSTFQWLENHDNAFAEAYRVLAPGGSFRFALFGARTLCELKESYRAALSKHDRKSGDRTHRFLASPAVATALDRAGFSETRVWSEDETELHPDVPTLLRSLKKIGAGNASPEHARSLAERRIMLSMMQLYGEKYGRDEGIPATYEVIYGWGFKKSERP